MLSMTAVGLFVRDMEKMVPFYRDVMGMQTDWAGEAHADLFSGGARLMLFGRDNFESMTGRNYAYPNGMNGTMELSFDVETYAQVDEEYERVVQAGAAPIFPPTDEPWGQRTSYVADPEGNLIEISSFKKD